MTAIQNQRPPLKIVLDLFSACDSEQVYKRTATVPHLGWDKEGHGHVLHLLGTAGSSQLPMITLHPYSAFITGMLLNIYP